MVGKGDVRKCFFFEKFQHYLRFFTNIDYNGAREKEYQANSRINAHGREVQRNKKLFDFETWLVAKIQFQGHNDLREVLASEHVLNSQIGMEFIKEFLT